MVLERCIAECHQRIADDGYDAAEQSDQWGYVNREEYWAKNGPCGTPVSNDEGAEETEPILTCCVRLVRQDVSQEMAGPDTPKLVDK